MLQLNFQCFFQVFVLWIWEHGLNVNQTNVKLGIMCSIHHQMLSNLKRSMYLPRSIDTRVDGKSGRRSLKWKTTKSNYQTALFHNHSDLPSTSSSNIKRLKSIEFYWNHFGFFSIFSWVRFSLDINYVSLSLIKFSRNE